jgi:putative ABC transport system permease protein
MIEEYFKIVIRSLVKRGVRTYLTMMGIFIGIAAVVSLVSLGQGLQESVNAQFNQLGLNTIIITPGGSFYGFGASAQLKEGDLKKIRQTRGVSDATGMLYKIARIEFNNEVIYKWVMGLPTDSSMDILTSIDNFNVLNGRKLESNDKNKATIGILYSEKGEVFKKAVELRDKIKIEGTDFTVVGINKRAGNPDDDSQIYIPLEQARLILDAPEKYDMFWAEILPGYESSDVADRIKKELRDYRGLKEGEEDFSIQTTEGLREASGTILSVVSAVVVGLAAISLFVGGLGIMNTMYTSVLERTKEIGVMKAVGARNSHILSLFLLESSILGAVGGAIGIVVGIALSNLIISAASAAGWSFFQASFPWYLIVGSFGFSFVVGTISGTLPAMQAAKMKPVDALRYE